jgi:DNA invertase Pin-like site-specific DNA recombinase
MAEKKVRAAIYARVSTTEQNPESQLEELRQYVQRRGFLLHKEYVDQVTGDFGKRKKKRRQRDLAYEELMADASKRLIDCVIVWKYDRFARSLSVLVEALDCFNKLGIDFISYTQEIDTTTPMGRLFYHIICSFSEFEKAMIVERVNAGLANARAKGVRLGRPEKDPSAAERITTLREEGWSFRKIAKRENLSPAGVLKILKRSNNSEASIAPDAKPTTSKAVTTAPKAIPDSLPEIWQLKVYLFIVKPQVWRRVLVPSDITLANLDDVIQKLFGWTDLGSHMWVPRNAKGGYELKCNETIFRLCDVDIKPGGGMLYEYCCDWTHEVSFEKVARFDDKLQYPVCIAGAMAIPPDAEFAGALDYMEARKKKRSRDFKVTTFINGLPYLPEPKPDYRDFDTQHFDLDEINKRLGVPTPEKIKDKSIKAAKSQETADSSLPELYQLRISICGVTPPIWRRVQVSSDTTLDQLSDIIHALFDWSGDHLHKFTFPTPWGRGNELNEDLPDTRLSTIKLQPGDSLVYEYDFGDSWMHEIVLEKVGKPNKSRVYPVCMAGKNSGPPEDCGGPEAYMNARNYLSRRKDKRGKAPRGRVSWSEKEFYKENYRSFDPDKFDKEEVNLRLAGLAETGDQ